MYYFSNPPGSKSFPSSFLTRFYNVVWGCFGLHRLVVIAHYRGENRQKFDVEKQTNKFGVKLTALNKNVAQNAFGFKKQRGSKPRSGTPTRSVTPTRDRTRSLTYSYERQKRAPSAHTIVRREHQAHCAHPAVGITSTEPGGLARLRKTICKLKRFVNDLERSTDILCRWSALIVVTIITPGTVRTSASSAT